MGRTGPWDVTRAFPERERIDLGSLQVPAAPGLDVQVNFTGDQALAVVVVRGDSMLQLQAFAAPKRAGLWDDIRRELIDELNAAGGRGEEAEGPFGPEVRARVPAEPGEGPRARIMQPARFLGADGPRWFLRGVISGPAAARPGAGEGTRGRLRGHRGRPRRSSDAAAGSARTAPARRGAAGARGADGAGGGERHPSCRTRLSAAPRSPRHGSWSRTRSPTPSPHRRRRRGTASLRAAGAVPGSRPPGSAPAGCGPRAPHRRDARRRVSISGRPLATARWHPRRGPERGLAAAGNPPQSAAALLGLLGGARGMLDSAVPGALFVAVYVGTRNLTTPLWIAAGAALRDLRCTGWSGGTRSGIRWAGSSAWPSPPGSPCSRVSRRTTSCPRSA